MTDIDRIRLGISGLGAFAALWAWLGGRAADPNVLHNGRGPRVDVIAVSLVGVPHVARLIVEIGN